MWPWKKALVVALGGLATKVAIDLYELSLSGLREVASVTTPDVEEPGEIVLSVVPVARRVERERWLFFFHRRSFETTYRIELENRDVEAPRGGRLVVTCAAGRIVEFSPHPLLAPGPAEGGLVDGSFSSGSFATAPMEHVFDLLLPPPGAVLDALVTVRARSQHVGAQDFAVELGHDGGVLRATPVSVEWDEGR
jgi:hypothetical protein